MGIYVDLEAALNTKLASLPNAPPIAWPNTRYEPEHGDIYIRPTVLPAATTLFVLDSTQEHKGIYQIDVFVPANSGIYYLCNFLDSIEDLFRTNLTLSAGSTTVYIQQIGRGPFTRQDNYLVGYISINYLCYSL